MTALDFYHKHYQDVAEPMLDMMRRGIRVDLGEAQRQRERLSARCHAIISELDSLIGADTCKCGHSQLVHPQLRTNVNAGKLRKDGKPRAVRWALVDGCVACECAAFDPLVPSLRTKKDLSSQRVSHLLYDIYKLPKQRKRGEENITADEIALRKLLHKCATVKPLTQPRPDTPYWKLHPEKVTEVILRILEYRELAKLGYYLDPDKFDIDSRVRCHYKVTTENGRLSSSRNPFGTGYNLQNTPRPGSAPHTHIRKIFLPEPGHVFLEADFSQIEDRIVKVLTKDPDLIEEARALPTSFDAHTRAAQRAFALILKCDPDEVDVKVEVTPGTSRRQMFKPFNHGCVDADTEVLTPTGWKKITRIRRGDVVAEWDSTTGEIRFVETERVTKKRYFGDMVRFETPSLSQQLTPDHRVVHQAHGKFHDLTAADAAQRKDLRIPIAGNHRRNSPAAEHWLRLAVAIQADGHVVKAVKDLLIQWHFKKHRKLQRICTLLDAANIKYRIRHNKDASVNVEAYGLEPAFYWLTQGKELRWQLLELDADDLRIVIEECQHWDGSISNDSRNRRVYISTSKQSAEVIQAAAHLSGSQGLLRVSERSDRKPLYTVSFNKRQYSRSGKASCVLHNDFVYCVTVPSSYFVIRKNNCVSITGNSNYGAKATRIQEMLLKDGIYLPKEMCEKLLDAAMVKPKLEFQKETRIRIMRERKLTNSWGRTLDFSAERLGDDVYRRGYAFRGASENADNLNQLGLVPLYNYLKEHNMESRIVAQVHDSLLVSCPPHEVYDVAAFLDKSMTQPREYEGVSLSVPVEFKMGTTWMCEKSYKALPTAEQLWQDAKEMVDGSVE